MEELLRRTFPGESEIASRLRSIDWNANELSTPDTWPQNLRTAIGICLASDVPMQVWWGQQRTVIYNDASIQLLGSLHPGGLARSGRDSELWARVGAAIDRCFGSEPVTCESVPADDESLVTWSFAPIAGDQGVDGVFATGIAVAAAAQRSKLAVAPPQATPSDTFLSVVAHELRNPLSALLTTLQALQLRSPSSEVEMMNRSARQLARMVDNLLDVSRLARGTLALQPRPVELSTIVDRAMEVCAPLFGERANQVFVRVPRTGLRLEGDVERIAQVIANALVNAAKYSDAGSRIWLEASHDSERVRLAIKDEGTGIEPERLASVFETFNHPPELRPRATGIGLGLAVSRSIVELHGGTIDVRSQGRGHGTEVVIDLPVEAKVAASVVAPVPKTRRRVLLVEDNDDTARSLKLALEQLGYTVALAHNGPIALNVARAFDPDVVLMDIGLPVMNGWELASRLRAIRGDAEVVPVVAVTALDQESDRRKSSDAGFAEHLVKPIDLARLEKTIESLPLRTPS